MYKRELNCTGMDDGLDAGRIFTMHARLSWKLLVLRQVFILL